MTADGLPDRLSASTETSRSLLARLKDSDPDAWDRLVNLYSPLIYHWCRRMGLPEQEMPDVFQDVFCAVARNIGSFRRDRPGDTFRGWLRTVTRNKVRDHYRRLARQPQPLGGTDAQKRLAQFPWPDEHGEQSDPADPAHPEDDNAEWQAHRELFRRALAGIRPHFHEQTWQAFRRVVLEGRSPRDVAEELAMQPGTVRVAKSRVLHRLRRELGELTD